MTNYTINLEKHVFKGPEGTPQPHLVVTAGIHGDEPSGEIAVRQIINELNTGQLKIEKGKLILFPVINPFAKDQNVRGLWGDTNRNITGHNPCDNVEDFIRRTLHDELSQISRAVSELKRNPQIWQDYHGVGGFWDPAWHLLDLHSVPLPGKAHVLLSDGPNDLFLAKTLGTSTIYTGWRRAYQNVDDADLSALGNTQKQHIDYTSATIYAARDLGCDTAVCLEAGQNEDPQSVRIAYQGIRNALAYCGLTDEKTLPFPPPDKYGLVEFKQVLIRRDKSEHLVGITADAQPLESGQVILHGGKGGRKVAVPQEGGNWIIAHPIPKAKVGQHFGFLAQKLG